MAKDRDRTTDEASTGEISSPNEELVRGVAEEGDEEFEDAEDLDEEEEVEDDGSI